MDTITSDEAAKITKSKQSKDAAKANVDSSRGSQNGASSSHKSKVDQAKSQGTHETSEQRRLTNEPLDEKDIEDGGVRIPDGNDRYKQLEP